jgi:2-polyprenyl-6-methoxyphenol hydroxylase-like FAD-dependent oxidoreductase
MNSETHRRQALVIGGSIAGLLAARVLADYYQGVMIIERDDLSMESKHRRGIPHGRHAHALLAGGQGAIEELLPGISAQLIESGAVEADPLNDGTWFFEGGAFCKFPSGITGVLVSRPLLESTIRRRVRSLPNVEIVGGLAVRGLIASKDGDRVIGVQLDDRSIGADLVVDASGRGSQAPAWLAAIGYEPPREEKVEIQLAYTTREFRFRNGSLGDDKFIVIAPTPDGKRGGVAALQEDGRFIVTLFGHFGQEAAGDLEGFIHFAKSLPSPLIYDAVRDADPIGEPSTFKFPANKRRKYESLRRFPKGFLTFGDAICSFDPIYGQGMSVAALEAIVLRNTMRRGGHDLARRFFGDAAGVIDNPWQIAVGGDLRMPETIGKRGLEVRIVNRYISSVHRNCHVDRRTALAFTQVAQLLAKPTSLFKPGLLLRVLWGNYFSRRQDLEKLDGNVFTTADHGNSLHQSGF